MCRQNLDSYLFSLDGDDLICETELLLDLFKHSEKLLVRTDQPSIINILCRVCKGDSPLIPTVPKIRVQCRNKILNLARVCSLPRLLIELDGKLRDIFDVEGLSRDLRRIEQRGE